MTVSPTLFRRSALTRRRLGAGLSAVALVALSAGWVGGGSANAAPLPAGLTLSPVINSATGLPICDPLDESPDYADVACNTVDHASAYFGGDGTVLGAGFVLEQTPVTGTNQAPFSSTTYVVQLGVGGVWTASIGIDAKGTNDTDYIYAGCAGAPAPTYTMLLSAALLDQTVTIAPDSGGFTRVTFNVPLSALSTCGITAATSLAPFFGTSQAGPLDNINKDFFIGNKVDFGVVATDATAVGPAAPSASVCVAGAPSKSTWTVPTTTGVQYKVDGNNVVSGSVREGLAPTVETLTAVALPGYKLTNPGFSQQIPFAAAAQNCTPATAVNAAPVTASSCVANAAVPSSWVVPTTAGVQYKVNGNNVVSGTTRSGSAPTSETLTAVALPGFTLTNPAFSQKIDFGTLATGCAPVIIPPVPSPSPSVSPSPSPSPAPVDEDLGISKTGLEDSVVPGDVLSWSVTVTNVKGTPASGFTVTDVLADGLTLLTAGGVDWSCTNAGQTITCAYSGAPLPVGSSSAFQIDSLVGFDYAGSTVSNTAVVDPGGVDTSNDSSTVVTPVVFTGGGGGTVVEPSPSPQPTEGGGEALPFTGSYTDLTLRAGVGLLVLGLFLALGGRRRRTN